MQPKYTLNQFSVPLYADKEYVGVVKVSAPSLEEATSSVQSCMDSLLLLYKDGDFREPSSIDVKDLDFPRNSRLFHLRSNLVFHDCQFSDNCEIGDVDGKGCVAFIGSVSFGDHCTIKQPATFAFESKLGRHTVIAQHSLIAGLSSIGMGSTIGDHTHLGRQIDYGPEIQYGDHLYFEEFDDTSIDRHPVITFSGFGSERRVSYYFNLSKNIYVRNGCFSGTLDEMEDMVDKLAEDDPRKPEYRLIIDLVRVRFNRPRPPKPAIST